MIFNSAYLLSNFHAPPVKNTFFSDRNAAPAVKQILLTTVKAQDEIAVGG